MNLQLSYASLPGIVSQTALEQHVRLWNGYIERAAAIGGSKDVAAALLHGLYFAQMTDKPHGGPGPKFEQLVGGSVGAWWEGMRACAREAHGWAITAIRGADLRIFKLEAHDVGGVIGYEPLVVVDCYEHAYWMDHGTRKDVYVDVLVKAMDWDEIERRCALRACGEFVDPSGQ